MHPTGAYHCWDAIETKKLSSGSTEKTNVLSPPMDWDNFNACAPHLKSTKALGILLPLTKEAAFRKAGRVGEDVCEEAYDFICDPRSENVSCTYFDWIARSSSTVTKMLVQTGKSKVERIVRAGVPLTPMPKEAIKVYVDFTLAEFTALGIEERWKEVRANAEHFLKHAVEDLVPEDTYLEPAKKVHWNYYDTAWESANGTFVLTKKGYDIFSKRAIERCLFPRLFLGHGQSESSGLCQPDEGTTMLWTNETLPQVLKRCEKINKANVHGTRHKEGRQRRVLLHLWLQGQYGMVPLWRSPRSAVAT